MKVKKAQLWTTGVLSVFYPKPGSSGHKSKQESKDGRCKLTLERASNGDQ